MKNKVIYLQVLILCLILSNTFATLNLKVLEKNHPALKKLKSSTFGQEIYDMLMVAIQTTSSSDTDPVYYIIQMLQHIKDTLGGIQTSNTNAMNDYAYNCNQNQQLYQAQIDDANYGISDQTKTIVQLQSDIDHDSLFLQSFQSSLDAKTSELSDSIQLRADRNIYYSQTKTSIQQSILDLTEGRQIIAQLLVTSPAASLLIQQKQKTNSNNLSRQSTSFVQISDALSKVINSKANQKSYVRTSARMITNFLQNFQQQDIQADQTKVQIILDLIDSLVDGLRKDIDTLDSIENDQLQAFTELEASLDDDINTLQNEIQSTQMQLYNAQSNLSTAQQSLSDFETQLQIYTDALNNSVSDCNHYMMDYDARTKTYNDQVSIIDQCLQIFENLQSDPINQDIQELGVKICPDGQKWSANDVTCIDDTTNQLIDNPLCADLYWDCGYEGDMMMVCGAVDLMNDPHYNTKRWFENVSGMILHGNSSTVTFYNVDGYSDTYNSLDVEQIYCLLDYPLKDGSGRLWNDQVAYIDIR